MSLGLKIPRVLIAEQIGDRPIGATSRWLLCMFEMTHSAKVDFRDSAGTEPLSGSPPTLYGNSVARGHYYRFPTTSPASLRLKFHFGYRLALRKVELVRVEGIWSLL